MTPVRSKKHFVPYRVLRVNTWRFCRSSDELRATPCPLTPTHGPQSSSSSPWRQTRATGGPLKFGSQLFQFISTVGRVVVEAAEPHSALEVVAVADGLYTLRYRTDDAWRGHEITRGADALVPFGASLPKRAKTVTTYRED